MFDDAVAKHNVPPGQLTLLADRGGPMKAKATALLLADLGVTRSHNRPHTSNDNPFSESHFKTLKYQPRFPRCFGCIEDARGFCRAFFDWYNRDHHHAGIGLMTPDQVDYGQTDAVHAARQATLATAFRENPERFVNKPPAPPEKPTAAWINPPTTKRLAWTPATQNQGQRRVACLSPFRPSNRHQQSQPACARWPASTLFRYVTPNGSSTHTPKPLTSHRRNHPPPYKPNASPKRQNYQASITNSAVSKSMTRSGPRAHQRLCGAEQILRLQQAAVTEHCL